MKRLLTILLAAAMLLALASCASTADQPAEASQTAEEPMAESQAPAEEAPEAPEEAPSQPASLRVAALKGPTGMGMSKLMEDYNNGETVNEYSFDLYSAPDELTGKIIAGEYDIAAVPTNLAAVLSSKTQGAVQLLAVNTLGVLYVMQNSPDGQTISDLSELEGKTIYATGQGSNPEYVLNYLLRQAGLEPGVDVTVEYLSAHDELVALAASGEVEYCMLPEPNVSVLANKNPDMKVAINMTEVWDRSEAQGQLTMGCLIVNTQFAADNAQAVADFLTEYQVSVDYVNSDPAAAAELIVKYEIVASAPIAKAALPSCNIVCITGDEVWPAVEGYYQVMFDADPTSLGGAMPEQSLVYLG